MKTLVKGSLREINRVPEVRKPWSEAKRDVIGYLTVLALIAVTLAFAYYKLVYVHRH